MTFDDVAFHSEHEDPFEKDIFELMENSAAQRKVTTGCTDGMAPFEGLFPPDMMDEYSWQESASADSVSFQSARSGGWGRALREGELPLDGFSSGGVSPIYQEAPPDMPKVPAWRPAPAKEPATAVKSKKGPAYYDAWGSAADDPSSSSSSACPQEARSIEGAHSGDEEDDAEEGDDDDDNDAGGRVPSQAELMEESSSSSSSSSSSVGPWKCKGPLIDGERGNCVVQPPYYDQVAQFLGAPSVLDEDACAVCVIRGEDASTWSRPGPAAQGVCSHKSGCSDVSRYMVSVYSTETERFTDQELCSAHSLCKRPTCQARKIHRDTMRRGRSLHHPFYLCLDGEMHCAYCVSTPLTALTTGRRDVPTGEPQRKRRRTGR